MKPSRILLHRFQICDPDDWTDELRELVKSGGGLSLFTSFKMAFSKGDGYN